ncbi:DUF5723 family protein [Persicobacter diffluens]|uniref:DUF5723 domain-containing protein n=1 Tax=Persicobacter diffluens TaxID=981 RepID=A0AAN4W1E1_9BACT|nr:hypothetical protein PEDI_45260 [Persicobacter diffluens]
MKYVFFILFLLIFSPSLGQFSQTAYQMDPNVLVYGFSLNPAFKPESSWMIGMPVLSNDELRVNANVSLDDVLLFEGGTIVFDLEHLILSNSDDLAGVFQAQVGMLSVGHHFGDHFLSFSADARAFGLFQLDGALLASLAQNLELPDGQYQFSQVEAKGDAFIQFAIGDAFTLNERWTVGARLKFMTGIGHVESTSLTGVAYVDRSTDFASITFDPGNIRAAGFDITDQGAVGFNNKGNYGFGIDLGAEFKINDQWTASTSVIDWGALRWKGNGISLGISETSYETPGTTLSKEEYYATLEEGLKESVVSDTIRGRQFWSDLPLRHFLGISYQWRPTHGFSAVLLNSRFESRWDAALSLGYNFSLGKAFSTTVTYTVSEGRADQFGLGLRTGFGPVQIFVAADDIVAVFDYKKTQKQAVSTGIYFLFGDR